MLFQCTHMCTNSYWIFKFSLSTIKVSQVHSFTILCLRNALQFATIRRTKQWCFVFLTNLVTISILIPKCLLKSTPYDHKNRESSRLRGKQIPQYHLITGLFQADQSHILKFLSDPHSVVLALYTVSATLVSLCCLTMHKVLLIATHHAAAPTLWVAGACRTTRTTVLQLDAAVRYMPKK